MRTRIWHSDWKPRWLIRCVSAALLSFMDKQEALCACEFMLWANYRSTPRSSWQYETDVLA